MTLRDMHYGDPEAMNTAIQEIIDQFATARARAMHCAPDDAGPAHSGHHQSRPQLGRA